MRESSPLTLEQEKALTYGVTKMGVTFIGYPLDIVRSRMWVGDISSVTAFRTIIAAEGMSGLYKRGFGSALIKLGSREIYRGYGYEYFGHGVFSALFNATIDSCTLPLDKIKVLQQNAAAQQSFWQCVKTVAQHGLLKELYQGASFYWAKQVYAYTLTINFQKLSDYSLKEYAYKTEDAVPFWPGLGGSLLAGCAVAMCTNPLTMALTKSQARLGGISSPMEVLKHTAQTQGAPGLLKGSLTGYAFSILGQMAYYTAKTWCRLLEERKGQNTLVYER